MPDAANRKTEFERLIGRARLVLVFERLWPPLVLGAAILASFVALSWLGLWLILPVWARVVGLVVVAAGLCFAAALGWRASGVRRPDILNRLDRDSGRRHRPISSAEDRLADPSPDPVTLALWEAHRRRLSEAAAAVKVKPPSPRLVDRDRFAIRAVALLALVLAGFVAGTDKEGRLAAAFSWHGGADAHAAGFRLDAWIDPPPYTGRAPVLLSGPNGTALPAVTGTIDVPVRSTVVVRSSGDGKVEIAADGGLTPVEVPAKAKAEGDGSGDSGIAETRFTLTGDGKLHVGRDGTPIAGFSLHAIPDQPPKIVMTGRPKGNLRGSLTLSYKIDDDYGVVGAEADFSQPVLDGKPITGRTLVEPPKMPLGLPNGARGLGDGATTADLSDHPWAGAEVAAVLSARDEGGNVGRSAPFTLRLPTRPFHKPLAKALVEQRRNLVLDPDHREKVKTALEALTIAPDLFGVTPAVFLGLQAAQNRLDDAKGDADLLGVADLLWSMALTIEDGDLSQTERDLRALQRELRDAIARHAPPEEIAKLADALRQQLDKMLTEMAQNNAGRPPNQGPNPQGTKTVTPQDLQNLLDRMERSAKNGDMADAQNLLDQLQNILENLRSARGDPSGGRNGKMSQSMGVLDRMMRDQQALRDKTFRRGNQQQGLRPPEMDEDQESQPGDQPQAGQENQDGDPQAGNDDSNKDLEGQQQALRQQLQQMQRQMRDLGLDGEKDFDDAERAMKDAENALGRGKPGSDRAVEAQGRALQGLQQGARGLQKQMAQGQGGGEGQQQGVEGMGRADGTGEQTGTDPLGRDRNGHLDAQHGFDDQEGLAGRARQVIEELRRRLGDRLRPQDEQDYLERLLKRY
ncbi:MAG TPA: TIGR02302 family protein [Lichenihabitans sp.]|nr:TIGR02302 family protein [Lichenihabitans sp.]